MLEGVSAPGLKGDGDGLVVGSDQRLGDGWDEQWLGGVDGARHALWEEAASCQGEEGRKRRLISKWVRATYGGLLLRGIKGLQGLTHSSHRLNKHTSCYHHDYHCIKF